MIKKLNEDYDYEDKYVEEVFAKKINEIIDEINPKTSPNNDFKKDCYNPICNKRREDFSGSIICEEDCKYRERNPS